MQVAEQRLKLPAYGKALIDNRRRGFHPLYVDVLYGDDWREAATRAKLEAAVFVKDGRNARPYEDRWLKEVGAPMLALRPREYAPGVYDFRCVAGCAVRLFDTVGAADDVDVDPAAVYPAQRTLRWGLFYDVVRELALFAASVALHVGMSDLGEDMAQYAIGVRHWDAEARRMVWPRWWSDEIEVRRGQRQFNWIGAAGYAASGRSAQAGA